MVDAPLNLFEHIERRAARSLLGLPPRAHVLLSRRPPIRIDGQVLHPEMQLLLAMREARGASQLSGSSVAEARARLRRESIVHSGVPRPVRAVRDFTIPGPAGSIPVRHYVPDAPGGPHPLLVYLHGGGFVVGDLETHDLPCRILCRDAGVHVLSVAYRLAPEHPFPAGIEDARAALRWAIEHAAELGADPTRVAIGGDSAGGNLSAVVTQLAAQGGEPLPAAQLLIYPTADRTRVHRSIELFGDGLFLTRADIDWFQRHYTGDLEDLSDPRISPLLARSLPRLPPAVVVTAAFDPLRDEGDAYAALLRELGTPTEHLRVPGLVHGFINLANLSRAARRSFRDIAAALRRTLERPR